jgi:hypothetical protein
MVSPADASLHMLRVHIAAVGFEVDRIVLPAKQMRADRVWLVVHNEPHDNKGAQFVERVKNKLESLNIECRQVEADRTDLFDILRALRTVILQEKQNSILVNVSVGSKIQAIGSMMACMMFKDAVRMIKPYYAFPEKYNSPPMKKQELEQETFGLRKTIPLPDYKIEIPSEKLIRCISIISTERDDKITKKMLKDLAIKNNLIHAVTKKTNTAKSSDQAEYMALNKNLIEPLLSWNFITVSKIGSNHIVSLTNEGRDALRFLNI